MTNGLRCSVCGGTAFTRRAVLWDSLIAEWQISRAEADYIDRQQGESCNACGANLRSIALADAVRSFLGTRAPLREAAQSAAGRALSLLEINEAGTLTPVLRQFGGYVFGAYPELDMHAIPYPAGVFDLVIHFDTLEHIPNPVHALSECRRVLKPGGALCFTVPIIVGRMSRDRNGLPRSFHGGPSSAPDDLLVRTEFGADAWTYVMAAGFNRVTIHATSYPAATAFAAYVEDRSIAS
jgi:SAM-dependent methyltransferase